MLSGRSGLRFALEALFLVLLAIGAGLADLRPLYIVLVMAAAWALVAIVEFTASRISAAPLSYLAPPQAEAVAGDEEPAPAWPMPEERTVVAPPEQQEPPPAPEPEPEPVEKPEPEVLVVEEPEPEPEPEPEREPEPTVEAEEPRRKRFGFRRRRARVEEDEPAAPPRHVKLLPRRTAPEPSQAEQEVAELFDQPGGREERSG